MRILHVIGSVAPRLGGPSKAVLEMSSALAADGHEVDVVTTALSDRGSWLPAMPAGDPQAVTGNRIAQDGYYITYCQPSWPTRWATSLQMVSVLRSRVPFVDVVHIHSLYLFPTLIASRLARWRGVPYVLRPHGTLDPYIRRRHRLKKGLYQWLIEASTLRHAAAIHFTTLEERELALPVLPPNVATYVVPLGVHVREFAGLAGRAAARSALGIGPEQFVWLFHGRLNHKKGLDLLASAFAEFAKRMPNAHLIVAGPDDDGLGKSIVRECARSGVAERVQLTGFLDRDRTRQALAGADAWILPSYSENFGVAVTEAMAAELPVVITDKVNIWREVQEAGAGVVTRAETASVLDAMFRVARLSTTQRAAMGERGRELCQRLFSWERIARELATVYSRVTTKA